jgi:hypothetical protein
MATPTETVTLRNLRPVMLPPIALMHHEVCAMSGTCLCQSQRVGVQRRGAKGGRALAVVSKRFPSTLTLTAKGTEGSTLTGLPLEVLHAAALKSLVASGAAQATRVPVAATAASATASAATTKES